MAALSAVLVAFSPCSGISASEAGDGLGEGEEHSSNDFSNRISLSDKQMVAGFNDSSLDGFYAGDGIEIELGDARAFRILPHEGTGVLLVRPDAGLKASAWRTVSKTFSESQDFSLTPIAEYSLFTQEGPAVRQWTRLRLFSGSKVYESEAQIIPTLWRTVMFNLSECRFLNKITGIEIGVMCESDEQWSRRQDFIIDGLCFGRPLDLGFMLKGTEMGFKGDGGKIDWKDDALRFRFTGTRGSGAGDGEGRGQSKAAATLFSPDLTGSRNSQFNPPLEDRNTFFVVMKNKSNVSKVRLSWKTTEGNCGSKEFGIVPNSAMMAYYFNISDCRTACGKLASFSLEALDGGRGEWLIDQIRFERELPITEYAGAVTACTADSKNIRISGSLNSEKASGYDSLAIYEYPFFNEGKPLAQLKLLHSCPASESFDIESIPNSRLDGMMTHLSTRFLAVVKNSDADWEPVCPPFFISNWRDFCENPYEFSLPDRTFNVLDYGAKGDAFTDDTRSIQKAIDECADAGGGHVLLPGDESAYGKRYVATHITIRSNVDLHFGEGAVLWQSYDLRDYDYIPAFGHDFDIAGCPWTHCMFLNYPLIQGNGIEKVKITGPGTIRMADQYCVNPDWTHYAKTCSDRIHICPIVLCNSKDIEISDIDEIRSNNYHTTFQGDTDIFIGNLKLYDVSCVSGDGFSFSQGSARVRIERGIFDSNDDGLVLCSSYKDPRGKISPWRMDVDSADHSLRDIKAEHCFINSANKGGGKAIAFIPWGSTNPDLTKQEIDSIEVRDCVLSGGHSVGTWCDNPFDGKVFTNEELDDYSPIKNVRIHNNEYLSPCDLLCVKPTNFITDCALHSRNDLVNGDFEDGSAYWTTEGNAGAENGSGYASDGGSIWEGLFLEEGSYSFSCEVNGCGELFCKGLAANESESTAKFETGQDEWKAATVRLTVKHKGDYSLGLRSDAHSAIRRCTLKLSGKP